MIWNSGQVNPIGTQNGISWPKHHLKTAKIKLKFWSGWLTAISCLTLIISIAVASVTYTTRYVYYFYVMPGTYGAFFGIIAGPLGIHAANTKRLSTTKCLWKAHIALCVITIVGSILGMSFGVLGSLDIANYLYRGYCDYYDYYYNGKICIQMYGLIVVETFLSFVLLFVSLICTWSFGCAKCCCDGGGGCCSPLPSFKQSDYDQLQSQISYQRAPIVAQPMANQMMAFNQPMSNAGNQIVQTPYGQTLMVPSNPTMFSPSQGQIYAQSNQSTQPGSYTIQTSNAVQTNPQSTPSVPLHSNINQMQSQSAAANPDAGQTIVPTTALVEPEVNQTPNVIPPPYPAITSNYQKPLPPINKPQSEPSQTDGGDNNAINDPPKPESQQNVENF